MREGVVVVNEWLVKEQGRLFLLKVTKYFVECYNPLFLFVFSFSLRLDISRSLIG